MTGQVFTSGENHVTIAKTCALKKLWPAIGATTSESGTLSLYCGYLWKLWGEFDRVGIHCGAENGRRRRRREPGSVHHSFIHSFISFFKKEKKTIPCFCFCQLSRRDGMVSALMEATRHMANRNLSPVPSVPYSYEFHLSSSHFFETTPPREIKYVN